MNVCRFLLAAVFIFSGFVKAVDPLGSFYKIQDYLTAFGMAAWFPTYLQLLFAIVLSALEFSVGVFLICYDSGIVADDRDDTADTVSGVSESGVRLWLFR